MKEVIVVLDNIRSALNVGAIFRTCSGAGVKKIYLVGITPYPPHPKVLKTALGTQDEVEYERIESIDQVIPELRNMNYKIYAIEETDSAKPFFEEEFTDKSAFIFGHEITGVSTNAISSADKTLILPMLGKKNSLNVATTVGIVLYNYKFAKWNIKNLE